MLEILVKESIELPAFSTLERIAYSSRARANKTYFRTITQALSPRTVDTLAALLSTKTDSGITHWQVLKSEPKKPSVRALEDFTAHTAWVKQLYDQVLVTPYQPPEEPLFCCAIPLCLEIYIYHFAILVHSPPEIVLLSIDLHEYFINVECVAVSLVPSLQSSSV